jgi:hypothetical protein
MPNVAQPRRSFKLLCCGAANGARDKPGCGRRKPIKPGWPGYQKPRPTQYFWRGRWFNRIRAPSFAYPPGYHYRIWRPRERLPALFLAAQFFYDNFAAFGLETPPPGYRWVRYGPDLLLVNVRTNEVEDVVHVAFY